MTTNNTAKLVTIEGDVFKRALKAALLATSNDFSRKHLWGVCFSSKDGKLRINATNGHWLFDYVSSVECPDIGDVIIDKDSVKGMIALIGKAPAVLITCEDSTVTLSAGGIKASYAKVDAKYPQVDQVIPTARGAIESIGVDACLMEAISKAFRTMDDGCGAKVTRMTFLGTMDPIVFDSEKVPGLKAILMPCRL